MFNEVKNFVDGVGPRRQAPGARYAVLPASSNAEK